MGGFCAVIGGTIEVHIGFILWILGYHCRLRLDGFSVGHRGTMEIQIGLILCEALGHHRGSDKVDFVRTLGTLWSFNMQDIVDPWGFRLG